jgi:NhaP-type Na+/H+ or K+/H+ antiporter
MGKYTKEYFKWLLVYGVAFGILTALFDYFESKTVLIWKNIIGGLLFGSVMSYLKIRTLKRRDEGKE